MVRFQTTTGGFAPSLHKDCCFLLLLSSMFPFVLYPFFCFFIFPCSPFPLFSFPFFRFSLFSLHFLPFSQFTFSHFPFYIFLLSLFTLSLIKFRGGTLDKKKSGTVEGFKRICKTETYDYNMFNILQKMFFN